jgi:hypothetical protein
MKTNYAQTLVLGFLGCAMVASLSMQAGNHLAINKVGDYKVGKIHNGRGTGTAGLDALLKPGDDEMEVLYSKISNFNAICDNKKVTLCWTTSSERENEYFIVEKSMDGKEWYTLATVKGMGNTGDANYYSVNDYPDNNNGGNTYYRLNLKVDHHTSYLKIVTGSKNKP